MNKNFIYQFFLQQKISHKLLILTLMFSTVIAFIITASQLYIDYKNGIKNINTQFSLVESSYLASLNQSIWVFDSKQITLLLDGILSLPDIGFTSLDLSAEGENIQKGTMNNENYLEKKYPLTYAYDSKQIKLGELRVVADLNKLYDQLIDKIFLILFSQGIKTFLISFFILYIFQRLLTDHIQRIAQHTKSLNVNTPPEPLILDKYVSKLHPDELDDLTYAINTMQTQLHQSFLDISEELKKRIKAEQFLLEYKKAFDASSYVSRGNLKGDIIYVNDAMCDITGYSREELIGKPHNMFRDKQTPAAFYKNMWDTIQDKKIWQGTIQSVKKNGNAFYSNETIIPILDTHGDIVEYIASRHDITELIENRQTIEILYVTDSLTGLGNRNKLLSDIQTVETPALAIIDIDSFKEVNDFYGHEIGDRVIVELGKRLSMYTQGRSAEIYRLQADQFAFLCRECISKETFEKNIQSLIENITQNSIIYQQYEILLGITVGLAIEDKDLFINADIALKMAKKLQKNYVIYNKDFNIEKEYKSNLEWTKKVKKALEEDRIIAFFQPIYNSHSKRVEKFESLVRMRDEDGTIISPFFFLEIAKRAKLYSKITIIMINKVIEAAKEHDCEFSINFTIEDILNAEVSSYFIEAIKANDIGHKIIIELVESEGIENFEEIEPFIIKIKQLGCKLAIDDFGTGYSNFEYLLKLNADYIKIDGSLIKHIDNNKDMQLITQNIVSFAKIAHIKTIAEFVSHQEIANIVRSLHVDFLQGYYISEPVSFDEIANIKNKII